MRFWDASALVPLLCRQPTTPSLRRRQVEDPAMVVWWGSRVECRSAIERIARKGLLRPEDLARVARRLVRLYLGLNEVPPSAALRDRAERLLALHPLSAADALQISAALAWARERPAGAGFVCLDERLRAAAAREGFVVQPA